MSHPARTILLSMLLALAAGLAIQPAQADECADRKARMRAYMLEAEDLRNLERLSLTWAKLSNVQLDRTISGLQHRVQLYERMTLQDPSALQFGLSYLLDLRASRTAGVSWEARERGFLKGLRLRRERVATNIAHSRAAMDSLHCNGTAPRQPEAGGSRGGDTQVSSAGCSGFTGKWSTYGGQAPMVLHGGSGSYEFRGIHSTISGTVNGRKLSGTWSQPGFYDPNWTSGRFEFTLSADGNSFSGTGWAKDGVTSDGWAGTCTGPAG